MGANQSEEVIRHLFVSSVSLRNVFTVRLTPGAVQGTRLGLHIMKHYVRMLNGFVKLESEVSKGTKVDVTFDHTSPD